MELQLPVHEKEPRMTLTQYPEIEAAKLWRRLPAAKSRASVARTIADQNPSKDNLARAHELEAGYQRLRSEYEAVKAQEQA